MAEFKFQIGDVVIFKSAIADCMLAASMGMERFPNCFTINERLAQECPGGLQLHYSLSGDGKRCLEHELARPEDFDATACRAIIEGVWDRRDAAREEAKIAWRLEVDRKRNPEKPALDLLEEAKAALVSVQDFNNAAEVRNVMDKIKRDALKAKAEKLASE